AEMPRLRRGGRAFGPPGAGPEGPPPPGAPGEGSGGGGGKGGEGGARGGPRGGDCGGGEGGPRRAHRGGARPGRGGGGVSGGGQARERALLGRAWRLPVAIEHHSGKVYFRELRGGGGQLFEETLAVFGPQTLLRLLILLWSINAEPDLANFLAVRPEAGEFRK